MSPHWNFPSTKFCGKFFIFPWFSGGTMFCYGNPVFIESQATSILQASITYSLASIMPRTPGYSWKAILNTPETDLLLSTCLSNETLRNEFCFNTKKSRSRIQRYSLRLNKLCKTNLIYKNWKEQSRQPQYALPFKAKTNSPRDTN